jgi:hypothetical protein
VRSRRLFLLSVTSAAAAFLAWLSMRFTPRSDVVMVAVILVQAMACLVAVVSSRMYLKRLPVAAGPRRNVALVVLVGSSAWLLFILLLTGGLLVIGDD